jgi:hypothetical protein
MPPDEPNRPEPQPRSGNWLLVGFVWALVSIPLLWGVWMTLKKSIVLFR